MGKVASKNLNVSLNSVALEDELTSAGLDIKQTNPVVTALSDEGPRRVVDNYDYTASLEGGFDGASGQGDATFFGMIGSDGVALAFDPTGAASPGPNDPHYDAASVVLESYSIKASVGSAVTYSAGLAGNSKLDRAVA